MDRQITRPRRKRAVVALAIALVVVALIGGAVWATDTGAVRVDRDRVTTATVERGAFQNFAAISGEALPLRSVQLDVIEGGRVEEVFVEADASVRQGQPILRLSNADLQLRVLSAEAQRVEQLGRIRDQRMGGQERALASDARVTEAAHHLRVAEEELARSRLLFEREAIARQEVDQAVRELDFRRAQHAHAVEAARAEASRQGALDGQARAEASRVGASVAVTRGVLDHLTIRSPIAGQLSGFDAQVGTLLTKGETLGQVDDVDAFRVRASVDEYYLADFREGVAATAEVGGETFALTASRVYPEVVDGRFEVDFDFDGAQPADVRRGQTLRLRVGLGAERDAVTIPNGPYLRASAGEWVLVLDEDGEGAFRRPVELGRKSPAAVEVLSGLAPGERVLTTGYDRLGDADRLRLD